MHRYRLLFVVAVCLALTASGQAEAQPANDHFANAINITSTPYTNTQNTNSATQEAGEQTNYCGGSGESVWYRYTATGNGTVIADAIGSSYDTVITVFVGTTLANLVATACNDDWSTVASYLPFRVVSGTTYYIRVNGYSGSSGSMTFHLSSPVSPLFTQCPVVGKAAGCEYLITAESDGDIVTADDTNQPPYPNFSTNARLIGVLNQSGAPLCAINFNAVDAFRTDQTLGICSDDVEPNPPGCPFGPTGYEGPGVTFEQVSGTFGTIHFDPCIPNNGSSYFSVPGNRGPSDAIYACAEDEVCGPDTDMDGVIDALDNCPNTANPDQANLDGDTQGDVCDSVDNQLVMRSASIKQKSSGRLVVVKGSIFQSEEVVDVPDPSDGFSIYVGDSAYVQYYLDLDALACVEEAAKITCASEDGTLTLQIKTSGISRGKAPFTLKYVGPEMTPPSLFIGPMNMTVAEGATAISRSGVASVCSTSPTKIVCRPAPAPEP